MSPRALIIGQRVRLRGFGPRGVIIAIDKWDYPDLPSVWLLQIELDNPPDPNNPFIKVLSRDADPI
jgi:heat shock protein HspQ